MKAVKIISSLIAGFAGLIGAIRGFRYVDNAGHGRKNDVFGIEAAGHAKAYELRMRTARGSGIPHE